MDVRIRMRANIAEAEPAAAAGAAGIGGGGELRRGRRRRVAGPPGTLRDRAARAAARRRSRFALAALPPLRLAPKVGDFLREGGVPSGAVGIGADRERCTRLVDSSLVLATYSLATTAHCSARRALRRARRWPRARADRRGPGCPATLTDQAEQLPALREGVRPTASRSRERRRARGRRRGGRRALCRWRRVRLRGRLHLRGVVGRAAAADAMARHAAHRCARRVRRGARSVGRRTAFGAGAAGI